ncbi:hypothetical protein N824_12785 [Pedobacter sp. V48]|nr:hypothetical protein N824_12785 [Pedobacter sp. V48]
MNRTVNRQIIFWRKATPLGVKVKNWFIFGMI